MPYFGEAPKSEKLQDVIRPFKDSDVSRPSDPIQMNPRSDLHTEHLSVGLQTKAWSQLYETNYDKIDWNK